jgi:hypothetical protein
MMDQELKAHLEAMEVRLVEKIRDTALLTARSRTHTATSSKMAHASKKHLFRYVDEFTWRLNEGNVANHTTRRLDSFVDATVGKRLTYKRLIA